MPTFSYDEWDYREYLETSRAKPECGSCHAQLDPIGLALEGYSPVGYSRWQYMNSAYIDTSAVIRGVPELSEGLEVRGMKQLAEALAKSPAFPACVVRKLYTYGTGRAYGANERPNVEALTARWLNGPFTFRDLIVQFVQSPAFRRTAAGGAR